MDKIKEIVEFAYWKAFDKDHTIIRFVTDWGTKKEDVEKLIEIL